MTTEDRWWFVYWDEATEKPAVWGEPAETDLERVSWLLDKAEQFGRDGDMNEETT